MRRFVIFNPLNAELNPIYHLLALLGVHHFLHVSRIRDNVNFNLVVRSVGIIKDLILLHSLL